jgi:hypothetical protein
MLNYEQKCKQDQIYTTNEVNLFINNIIVLETKLEIIDAHIRMIEGRLHQNSYNSSFPPSSDVQ